MERSVKNAFNNQKGIDSSDIPIAEMFQGKIRSAFQQLYNADRTPACWSLFHSMVETIKNFICAECVADFSLHLSCIINWMFDVFAATGHRNYAKGSGLCVLESMCQTLVMEKNLLSRLGYSHQKFQRKQ